MAILEYTFLIRIEIDTEQTMPCECGHRRNTFPDWPWKYKSREHEFVNETWRDFRSRFHYDGLRCQISTIANSEFEYLFVQTNNDKLDDARRLIEEVYESIYPQADEPSSSFEREWIQECDNTFSKLTNQLHVVDEYVERIESLRSEEQRELE